MKPTITAAERAGMAQAISAEIARACAVVREECARQVASVRDEVSVLRSALLADDPPTGAALEALAVERQALDALIAEAERLTGREVRERLSAMRARLVALDAGLH